MEDTDLFMAMALADRLGKTLGEIMKISVSEMILWAGYLRALEKKKAAS